VKVCHVYVDSQLAIVRCFNVFNVANICILKHTEGDCVCYPVLCQ